MILELVVATRNPDSTPHFSPMGIEVSEEFDWTEAGQEFELKPFVPSTTLENFFDHSTGVLQSTQDMAVFAQCLLKYKTTPTLVSLVKELWSEVRWSTVEGGFLLDSASLGISFEVASIQPDQQRAIVKCRSVECYENRSKIFGGLNRAKSMILETLIWGTREDRVPAEFIKGKLDEFGPIVDRTGSSRDKKVWKFLECWFRSENSDS